MKAAETVRGGGPDAARKATARVGLRAGSDQTPEGRVMVVKTKPNQEKG